MKLFLQNLEFLKKFCENVQYAAVYFQAKCWVFGQLSKYFNENLYKNLKQNYFDNIST